jgi:acyl carrier protein
MVRRLPDGRMEFLGRNDFQVKIRGQRIDVAQVETTLAEYPGIQRCAVIGLQAGRGDAQLIAYYTWPGNGSIDGAPTHNQLFACVSERLPAYMVPTRFILLPQLPALANGKLDRKTLIGMKVPGLDTRPRRPPEGESEVSIAQIWAELLKLDVSEIGRDDNFFALGGNSLDAARLRVRIRERLACDVELEDLFDNAVLSEQAKVVTAAAKEGELDRPTALPRHRTFPLSYFQRAQWLIYERNPSSPNNLGGALLLEGPLSVPALEQALTLLIERHETLRTRFVMSSGDTEPHQEIDPAEPVRLYVVDATARDIEALAGEHAKRLFSLERGPLVDVRLFRMGTDRYVLSLVLHHILV